MKLTIITNLYPRPDQPVRGLYNAQLFESMAAAAEKNAEGGARSVEYGLLNVGRRTWNVRGKVLPTASGEQGSGPGSEVIHPTVHIPQSTSLTVICLVPEWRIWRWAAIRRWNVGSGTWKVGSGTGQAASDQSADVGGQPDLLPSSDSPQPTAHNPKFSGLMSLCPCSTSHVLPSTFYLPVFYLPLIGRNLSWMTYGAALHRIEKTVGECDAILATWLYPDAVAAAGLARRLKKPLWIKVHGSDIFHLRNGFLRKRILDACAYAKGVISNCRYLADRLVEAGVATHKIHVVANGVDRNVFKFRARGEAVKQRSEVGGRRSENSLCDLRELCARFPERKIVLFVGNLFTFKGPDLLLEAWKRVVEGGRRNVEGGTWEVEGGQRRTVEGGTLNVEGGQKRTVERGTLNVEGGRRRTVERGTWDVEGGRRRTVEGGTLNVEGGQRRTVEGGTWDVEGGRRRTVERGTWDVEGGQKRTVEGGTWDVEGAGPPGSHGPQSRAPGSRSTPRLLLIGDGPMREFLERTARRLGIAHSVEFLGSRPHEEVALWMNASDCLCLPSRSEGMPNVVLEALASGLPVVASDAGGVSSVVVDGKNGLIAGRGANEADRVRLIAEALENALARKWNRQGIASSAGTHGWDRAAEEVISLIGGSLNSIT